MERDICLEEISNTPDDNEIGYFIAVDLNYPDIIKEKTKNFPFCPENMKINPNKYNDYMNNKKPKNYTKSKKLMCDWTDNKKCLIHYRMLKFHVRHGMIDEKIHEILSFKQSGWLEKYISFNTRKRNRAKNDFDKDFFKLLVNAAFGKFLENVRNRLELELLKKDDIKKVLNGIQIYHSMVFINHMKTMIVIHSKRTKWIWIKLSMLVLLFWS